MFSNNNRISDRQLRRLLILDLFAPASLLLPGLLSDLSAADAAFAIAAGFLLSAGYVWILCIIRSEAERQNVSFAGYITGSIGKMGAAVVLFFYLLHFLLMASYVLALFVRFVKWALLDGENDVQLLILLLLLCCYAAARRLEARARVYEILCPVIFFFLSVMLILACFLVDPDEWLPAASSGYLDFFIGVYRVFLFTAVSVCLLFMGKGAFEAKRRRTVCSALWISGVFLIAVELITAGVFGQATVRSQKWPVIVLMSMIQVPGGISERQDVVMSGIWVVCLFALLCTFLFYAKETSAMILKEQKRPFLLAPAAALCGIGAYVLLCEPLCRTWLEQYFYRIGVPVLLSLPVVIYLSDRLGIRYWKNEQRKNRQQKKGMKSRIIERKIRIFIAAFLMLGILSLCGCTGKELEERDFQMILSIDRTDDVKAKLDNTDYSHLKAIVFAENILENKEELVRVLEEMQNQKEFPKNAVLYWCETNSSSLISRLKRFYEKGEDDSGEEKLWMELGSMLESQDEYSQSKQVTLGDLIVWWHNENRNILIPKLGIAENGNSSILAYGVLASDGWEGELEKEEAVKLLLLRGELSEYAAFSMEDESERYDLLLSKIRVEKQLTQTEEGEPQLCVTIRAQAEVTDGLLSSGEEIVRLQALAEEELSKELLLAAETKVETKTDTKTEETAIDWLDASVMLGSNRKLYEVYCKNGGRLEDDLQYEVAVKIVIE
jgi:hypothetical protein